MTRSLADACPTVDRKAMELPTRRNSTIFTLLAAFVLSQSAAVRGDQPTPEQVQFFEKRIRPVLVAKCYSCHSAAAQAKNKLRGRLRLDTREGPRAGGD